MAALAIIFFAPFLVVVAVVIFVSDGFPILYAQDRIGLNGRLFRCYKFRSMVRDADQRLDALLRSDPVALVEWNATRKLRHDPRITGIGDFLRKSSLDELPQLWNVLKGDMSIVGPRPIVAAEAEQYGTHFNVYTSVRPGLTGLWQVSGRSDTTYQRRVMLDCEYVASRNLWLDIAIMLRTVKVVLLRAGAR